MLAQRMPPLPKELLAGVSGGADSVALLHLLLETGVRVTAIHVNHGLRGEHSDADEAFVREVCRELQVPLLTYRGNPPENPGEDWARQLRYECFREAAEATGIAVIALAHHRDDQAETLLLHLLRGSGLTGLTAMAMDSQRDGLRILRPLLEFSREELREYLRRHGQSWREDASNADPRYLRNALRREILPELERMAPGAAGRLARTAALLREDELVLTELTERFLREATGCYLPLRALREQPLALQRRIVREWWSRICAQEQAEHSLSAAQTEVLVSLIGGPAGAKCNLPGGWHGQSGWTHLHLISPERVKTTQAQPLLGYEGIEITPAHGQTGDGSISQAFRRSSLEGLTVRTRQPGDWIRPFGSSGRQLLQDYLMNRRVDAPFRDRVPLVCRGSEVLLAGGVGAGGVARMDEEKQDDWVLIRWKQEFPWHDQHSR